jgi:tetratricopeptide (TPR) repeat protein
VSKIYRALERAESEQRTGRRPDGARASASVLEPENAHHLELPERREEFEKLKVMLTLEAKRNDVRSVMLVSALSGEGVTTVALGLAQGAYELALAYAGYGRLHQQQGHITQAREYLTRALAIFEDASALADVEYAVFDEVQQLKNSSTRGYIKTHGFSLTGPRRNCNERKVTSPCD